MSRIEIDENRCKGCGLCTTVCPFDLIRISERFSAKGYRPAEYIENRPGDGVNAPDSVSSAAGPSDRQCTGCANCATMCPDVAITVYRSSRSTSTMYRISVGAKPLQADGDRRQAAPQNDRGNGNRRDQRKQIRRARGAHRS
jgi:2-oxoglutarate ferredoxin oxidoreductase subunit delta